MAPLVHLAFLMYVLSYALPAVVIAGDTVFGFAAALFSFIGLGIAIDLEGGQAPACLLGVLANVLMVGGYACYNLRPFSKKAIPTYLQEARLTQLAAVCALCALVCLEAGNEAFHSLVGCYVWLASMVTAAFACWKQQNAACRAADVQPLHALPTQGADSSPTKQPGEAVETPIQRPLRGRRWLLWTVLSLVLVVSTVFILGQHYYREHIREQQLRAIDERIVTEVERELTKELRGLAKTHEIRQRYGKFIGLTNVRWSRPRYIGQLVVRISMSATVRFEEAQAKIMLGINKGDKLAIERLAMEPSAEWRREHAELAEALVLVDNEFWLVRQDGSGSTQSILQGWATHPHFSYGR